MTIEMQHAVRPTSAPPVESTLEQIVRQARQTLGCDAVGLLHRRSPRASLDVLTSSEPAAAEADQLQLRYQEGPGVDPHSGGILTLSGDTRTDQRWPRWGPRAADLGWLSTLAAPLVTPQRSLGVLTLYSRRPAAFDASTGAAEIFALYAATALASTQQKAQLEEAVAARHRIGLAQGILMHERGLGPDAAFELLRRYSQDHNLKLWTVAQHVVETGQLPSAPKPKLGLSATQAA